MIIVGQTPVTDGAEACPEGKIKDKSKKTKVKRKVRQKTKVKR